MISKDEIIFNKIVNSNNYSSGLVAPSNPNHCYVTKHSFDDFYIEVLHNGCPTAPVIFNGQEIHRIPTDTFRSALRIRLSFTEQNFFGGTIE